MIDLNRFVLSRMNIEDIQPGMVLEMDLYSSQGALLANAGTLLTEEKYTAMVRMGIHIIDYDASPPVDAIGSIPLSKQEEFNDFRAAYVEKEKAVGACLQQIGNGEVIELEKTFELTDNIISRLESKNDVFLYLGFMKNFDNHTFSHCSNVSLLCNVFGNWLKLDTKQVMELTVAGLLHDVGKTRIPIEIINKTGRLTEQEFIVIKDHTVQGYKLLKQQKLPQELRMAALQHHEKMDGTGYPFGSKGDAIVFYSRIVAICDIYDAMTATRSYHAKRCPFDVINTFETGLYGELDTELLFKFLNNIAFVYLNTTVVLSDGQEAEVVFIPEKTPSRPMVKTADGAFINLTENPGLSIQRIK